MLKKSKIANLNKLLMGVSMKYANLSLNQQNLILIAYEAFELFDLKLDR